MDEFGQGSESFADEGLDIVKEGGQQVAHQAGRMAKKESAKPPGAFERGSSPLLRK